MITQMELQLLLNYDPITGKFNWLFSRQGATPEQNSRNYGAQSNNELGIKGVYLIRGKYSAYIYYENKLHFLGSFDNAEEAQEIHKAKSLEIQKEFSFYSREKVMSNG